MTTFQEFCREREQAEAEFRAPLIEKMRTSASLSEALGYLIKIIEYRHDEDDEAGISASRRHMETIRGIIDGLKAAGK